MKAPCKDCPDRHPNCHSQCEAYQEYAAFNRAKNEQRVKENIGIYEMRNRKAKAHYRKIKKSKR